MSDIGTLKRDIILNDVLISRVSLTAPFKPKNPQIDPRTGAARPDKYHVDAVFSETHPQFKEIQTVIRGVAADAWGDKAQAYLDMIKGNNQRFCLQRGDQYRPGKPEYAGMLYISASNEMQPTIGYTVNGVNVFNRGTPTQAVPSDEKWPYAGCKANLHLQFYAYTFSNSPGIGCSVLGVQFAAHGARLAGSRVSSGKEFGIVLGEADKAPPAQASGGGLI